MADFNKLALFYDFLKRLVFQSTLDKASRYYISDLRSDSDILIIGGGTGELLQYFNATQSIVYVEKSSKMIDKAKQRSTKAKIDFRCADITSHEFNKQFDYIITPFVLDCFPVQDLKIMMLSLKYHLKVGGYWLHTDFYPQNWMQKRLVALMYFFFRKTTGLSVSKIPDFNRLFTNINLEEKKNVRFKHGLIQSKYYQNIG